MHIYKSYPGQFDTQFSFTFLLLIYVICLVRLVAGGLVLLVLFVLVEPRPSNHPKIHMNAHMV